MRILFVGRGKRAEVCLKAILNKEIVGVVNIDDEIIKEIAKKNNIPLFNPININDSKFIDVIKRKNIDLIVTANCPYIFKKEPLSVPKKGCINLHGGPLPKYRGGSPLNWAIINGEKKTGVTIIQMDEGIDTGDVLAQEMFDIEAEDDIYTVHKKANEIFKKLLIKVIDNFESGAVIRMKQDESKATYYPQREPRDGLINWKTMTKEQIYNMIRALTHPYPGAFTYLNGRKAYLWKAKLSDKNLLITECEIIWD